MFKNRLYRMTRVHRSADAAHCGRATHIMPLYAAEKADLVLKLVFLGKRHCLSHFEGIIC